MVSRIVPTDLHACGGEETEDVPTHVALPLEGGIENHVVLETGCLPDGVLLPEKWFVVSDGEVPILELHFNHENGFRQLRTRQYCLALPDNWTSAAPYTGDLHLCDVVSSEYTEEMFTPKGCVWFKNTLFFPCDVAILDTDGEEHGLIGCNDRLVGVDTNGDPIVASKSVDSNKWRVLGREFDDRPIKILFDHSGIPLFCFNTKIMRWSCDEELVEFESKRSWENFIIDHPVERTPTSRLMLFHPGEVVVLYAHTLTKKEVVWRPPPGSCITCADYYKNDLVVCVWNGKRSAMHRWKPKAVNRKCRKRSRVDTEVNTGKAALMSAPIFAVRFNSQSEIVWGGNMGFQGNLPLISGSSSYSHVALEKRPEWCVVEIVGSADHLIVMTPEHAYPLNDLGSPLECMRVPIRGQRAVCPDGPPKTRFCGMYWGDHVEVDDSNKLKLKGSDLCACDSGLEYQHCCQKFHSDPIISECDTDDDHHVFLATVPRFAKVQHLLGIEDLEMNETTVKRFGRKTFNPNRGHFMVSGQGSTRLINDRQLCARHASHYSILKVPVTVYAHTIVHVVPRGNRNGKKLRPEPCGVVCTISEEGQQTGIMSLHYGWEQ